MFLPRFTLRWILAAMAACAVVFVVASSALRGQPGALAAVVALGTLALAVAAYIVTFLCAWLISSILVSGRRPSGGGSPFASSAPPPQIVPPQEPA